MPTYQKHVFVCTHGPFCWFDGDPDGLLEALKKRAAAAGLKDDVRINRAGCLNACGHGPAVVVYPDCVWYGHVQESDADELFESHILAGEPLQRLQLPADSVKQTDHYPVEVQRFKNTERMLDEQRQAARDAIRATLSE